MAGGFSSDSHWRDSARLPRFFMIDARAAFFLLLFLLHIRWWTFAVAVVAIIFFTIIEHYGFTLRVFVRWLRNVAAGPRKAAVPWWKR